jgi:NAD(P)-dependent dehydrogenase (short-subunit alcohol dehydrogenase family)
MSGQLSGQAALVTGAGSGIGRATAEALAAEGASVAVLDRAGAAAGAVAASLSGAVAAPCDLARASEIGIAVDRVAAAFGRLDMLVNCAGILGPRTALADVTAEAWDEVHAINVRGAVLVTQAVVPHVLRGGRGGRIVNVSSAAAHRAAAYSLPYASSKAALEAVTRVLAGELAPHDINVNAVAPGITATAIYGPEDSDGARTARARQATSANLFGRFSEPEDIAAAILYLCSPGSRQVTGQVVHVSAGASV